MIRCVLVCLLSILSIQDLKADRIYVNAFSNSTIQNGVSWNTAYSHLQDALAVAKAGDEIWITKGTFYPTTSNNRDISFVIPQEVLLYGGFEGIEEAIEERNPNQRTILSGNIGHPDSLSDNTRTVVYISTSYGFVLLDGFSIEQGYSDGVASDPRLGEKVNGGGLYVDGRSGDTAIVLENCVFASNEASFNGAAIFILNNLCDGAAVQFNNCSFTENKCGFGGGLFQWIIEEMIPILLK